MKQILSAQELKLLKAYRNAQREVAKLRERWWASDSRSILDEAIGREDGLRLACKLLGLQDKGE